MKIITIHQKIMINKYLLATFLCNIIGFLSADEVPTINPMATIQTKDGEKITSNYSGSAPLKVTFNANTENTAGWNSYYEWRFNLEEDQTPYLIRYEENTEYTFTKAGTHNIRLYAKFVQGNDTISYTQDFWNLKDPITISISESILQMPNAFSPNEDGINDIYKAKNGYQSITEFHAYIFNRWGQKLYEWTDPAGGWDGKFNGKPVEEGVYFVLVEAKGADGKKYHIRRDVNLLRGYTVGGVRSSGE